MSSKLQLLTVTAICINGDPLTREDLKHYRKIIKYMQSIVDFANIKLVMTSNPRIKNTEFIKISKFRSATDRNNFFLANLHEYVQTDHCIIFDKNGFIINPDQWDPAFLSYDYIGSPWPLYIGWPVEGKQVGNGSFSIRSRKLLEFVKGIRVGNNNEDATLVYDHREAINDAGFTFAPVEIARKFSVESSIDDDHTPDQTFGFFGEGWTPSVFRKIFGKTFTEGVQKIPELINFKIDSLLEIGSADGIDADYLAKKFSINPERVHIIEPRPDAAIEIRNKFSSYNVYELAISNYDSSAGLFYVRDSGLEELSSLRLRENDDSFYSRSIAVQVRTIETFAKENNITEIDLIKIDAEGCSFEVIQGIGGLLNKVKAIHVEVENINFWKDQHLKADIIKLLEPQFTIVHSSGNNQEDLILINKSLIDTILK